MVKNHLKRIATPRTWHVARKQSKFITRPNPGAHPFEQSMALSTFLREVLKVAKTAREVRFILHNSQVLVDGKRRRDEKFNIGLMDTISFPESKQQFRVTLDAKGRLSAVEIDEKEANKKISQVKSIKTVKGKKTQLGLADGRCIFIDKNDYARGDVVLIELPSQKILKHFKCEKKKPILLVGGKHAGKKAVIDHLEDDMIVFETENKEKFETKKEYAFITGDKEPEVTL
ncbi:30S ribosomal protein S4e [Candidatus Woesearchaeota archaeon]|nr:MAG: 30S ribosomal protein S4e [Candidatus Woesearchaeota archaeon]